MPLPLRYLYIDFNSFFASVEQQLNPLLRGKPVIVVPAATDYTSAIAASYEAKKLGIKTNTLVKDAKAICPEIMCVLGNHEHYVRVHELAVAEIHRHIPVSQVCSIDEVACELMANEQSIEAVSRIAHNIKAGLARSIGPHITCSIGVAPNKYLAKVATDMQKPNVFTILQESDLPEKLLPLPLKDFPGIGRNMEARLHKAGIYTTQQLWAQNAKQLRRLWGNVWGEKMYYFLRGIHLADVETTRSSVGHSHVLAPELRPREQTHFVARRLTLKAASRLRRLEYDTRMMTISLRSEEGARYAAEAQFAPASDSMTLLHVMEALWASLAEKASRFKKVSITLHHLVPRQAHQLALLEEMRGAEKYNKLSAAMDHINQRFGRDTILQGMMPQQGRGFSGTKIAFTRIPDIQEFRE